MNTSGDWTRRRWLALPTAAALALRPGAVRADGVPAQPGETVRWPAPITLLDGSVWTPRPGFAHVVVFWSTTCPFCRRHNQHVEKLQRAVAGRPLAVLGVARDRDAEVVRRHAQQHGYGFPITLQSEALRAALATRNVIPLTITIDRQGRLKQAIPGEMFEEDVMELASLAT